MKVKKKLDKKNTPKNLFKNKRFIIVSIFILLAFVVVFLIVAFSDRSHWKSSESRTSARIYTLIIFIPLGILWFVFSLITIYAIRFSSIKEEIYYHKEKFPDDIHNVLSVLNNTKTDCFVLAYFKKRHEIRPAVYTVRGKRITYLNLRIQETFFKKIYPNEDDLEKYVRAYRIKNKSTNSQMLFFASDIKSLEIQINNHSVPIMYSDDKIGDFAVYGITEPTDGTLNNSVNINGCDYPLTETPVNSYFINTSEI